MLFNSYLYILLFLPLTAVGYYSLARWSRESALIWLVGCSLFFYGWWEPVYIALLVPSILFNFYFGRLLSVNRTRGLFAAGIILNLAVLAYYKYSGFAIQTINAIFSADFSGHSVVLPLAISFFTFQQIAFLADARSGTTREYRLSHYFLFVSFFPQLIAGPIVHHREMMPQFMRRFSTRYLGRDVAVGISIFVVGLAKKVLVADSLAPYANQTFDAAAAGNVLTFFESWRGVLAYTFQLYFDFSGYSDMAIGAARIFGIRIPVNFNSPYKATSVIDFWRRWHITLSRFLRDYLYIPLGGNRKGTGRRYANILVTMVLGGLWHGAGWTFVFWGLLHGIYLVVNHAWSRLRELTGIPAGGTMYRGVARTTTFVAVAAAWTFFRAPDFNTAWSMIQAMFGQNGVAWPALKTHELGILANPLVNAGIRITDTPYFNGMTDLFIVAVLLASVWKLPNSNQLFGHIRHAAPGARGILRLRSLRWRPTRSWGIVIATLAVYSILRLENVREFLYFQF